MTSNSDSSPVVVLDSGRTVHVTNGLYPKLAEAGMSPWWASVSGRLRREEKTLCLRCGTLNQRTVLHWASAWMELLPVELEYPARRWVICALGAAAVLPGILWRHSLFQGFLVGLASIFAACVLDSLFLRLVASVGHPLLRLQLSREGACPRCHSRRAVALKALRTGHHTRIPCASCGRREMLVESVVDSWETDN